MSQNYHFHYFHDCFIIENILCNFLLCCFFTRNTGFSLIILSFSTFFSRKVHISLLLTSFCCMYTISNVFRFSMGFLFSMDFFSDFFSQWWLDFMIYLSIFVYVSFFLCINSIFEIKTCFMLRSKECINGQQDSFLRPTFNLASTSTTQSHLASIELIK